MFNQITYLQECYLTNAEIDILVKYGSEMADMIQSNSIIIELGVGSMRKTKIILERLLQKSKVSVYYAIDLDYGTLQAALCEMSLVLFFSVILTTRYFLQFPLLV